MAIRRSENDHWIARTLHVMAALILCWSATGLLAGGAVQAIGGGADDSLTASTRTVVACTGLLAIAWLGGRYRLEELSWIVYPSIALIGVKLLIEDLYLGRPATITVSLLAYAAALILAPRLAKSVAVPYSRAAASGK